MTKLRVTRLICISCRGSGVDAVNTACPCWLCYGERKLPVGRALDAAERRYRLARGGLASGDYAADTAARLQRDAASVYAIAGLTPPWADGVAP